MSGIIAASSLALARDNLTSVPVLAFVVGLVATLARSEMRLPESAVKLISAYLLFAIGLKGGHKLASTSAGDMVGPTIATIGLGVVIPLAVFGVLRWWARFSLADSGAIAAHYGSVSAVTFTAAAAFATTAGHAPEGFMPALVAIMEIPGIVLPLVIVALLTGRASLKEALTEVLLGKSVMLLGGGLLIGWLAGPRGFADVAPFFEAPFKGVLALFLLELGALAATHLQAVRKVGRQLVGLAVVGPVIFGTIGVAAGAAAGLSTGGAAVLGAMAASASYIAAPAAVSVALPDANPAYSLTAALGITFPFNLVIGIPLTLQLAIWLG